VLLTFFLKFKLIAFILWNIVGQQSITNIDRYLEYEYKLYNILVYLYILHINNEHFKERILPN